jgi:hypothetical protein
MQSVLPVHGQGVFVFENTSNAKSCVFRITTSDQTNGLKIEFNSEHVLVNEIKSMKPLIDSKNKKGLIDLSGAYYWFSLDSQNQRFYAGIGEARLETLAYSYTFENKTKDEYTLNKSFLESLTTIHYTDSISQLRVLKDPITQKIALSVKDTHSLTMEHIASNAYVPKANLSPVSQKLYECIAGKKFVLNTHDFPDFSEAIEYSIATPGLWCYTKLREKSTEFNPDKPNLAETYLRITLGQNNGESPGIPYVMEIWPVGHFSPIHSHSNANAIIRVLNGEINVSLYPFLCTEKDGIEPFGKATFHKDDITWISPTLNQTHQLKNLETNHSTCITIQCYMYTSNDNKHYDYFDYLDDTGAKQLYEPDSDMDFLDFKKKMKEEWDARPRVVKVQEVKAKCFCFCWK